MHQYVIEILFESFKHFSFIWFVDCFFFWGGEFKMGWYKYFLSLLAIMIATRQTTVTVVFLRICLNM